LRFLRAQYEPPADGDPRVLRGRLPYRRAATSFMRWQLSRGLLQPLCAARPGSEWWRAINEALLADTAEARYLVAGAPGPPSSPAVAAAVEFNRQPSAARWYRAHNMSIASAYLAHREAAEAENRIERFFINLVLVRVLFAHALVAAPRFALSWCSPLAPLLGDPRLGMTAIFLSLSRVLPAEYPLLGKLDDYAGAEHGFGRLLDLGLIAPRLEALYEWSADELALPQLRELVCGGVPAYAWPASDADAWRIPPQRVVRWARRVLPPASGR
jgi:hypothetical protein